MARPLPSGPPPAPPVQRLTIRYAKRGRMRFASHRDVARAMERGVRKAGVPVAYSAGFSPHPRISYLGGAPTGMTEASAATGPVIGELPERMPELRQHHQDPVPRHEVHLPPRTTDKAMQPKAESAQEAPASRLRAN